MVCCVVWGAMSYGAVPFLDQKEECQRALIRSVLNTLTPVFNKSKLAVAAYCCTRREFTMRWNNGEIQVIAAHHLERARATLLCAFCNEHLTKTHQLVRWKRSFEVGVREQLCLVKVWQSIHNWY